MDPSFVVCCYFVTACRLLHLLPFQVSYKKQIEALIEVENYQSIHEYCEIIKNAHENFPGYSNLRALWYHV
jgi:hypothetical protein